MRDQKGNIIVIVLIVVTMVIVAGGVFYFLSLNSKNNESSKQDIVPYSQTNKNSVSPTKAPSSLTSELDSVQIDESDSSFSQLDQDLKDL